VLFTDDRYLYLLARKKQEQKQEQEHPTDESALRRNPWMEVSEFRFSSSEPEIQRETPIERLFNQDSEIENFPEAESRTRRARMIRAIMRPRLLGQTDDLSDFEDQLEEESDSSNIEESRHLTPLETQRVFHFDDFESHFQFLMLLFCLMNL
jgi:hypothetical protein